MQLTLERHAGVPIYRQIVNQLRDQIHAGGLPRGSRLPPVRALASDLGLTRLTVHSAYAELQALGLVEAHVGRGTFVAADVQAVPELPPEREAAPWVSQNILANLLSHRDRENFLSFAQAFPAPDTYPRREIGRALQATLMGQDGLGYGHIQGEPELRETLSALLLDRGLKTSADDVLITSGAQQGIDVALRALTGPGDVILVEEPVYPGVLELAAQRGQRVVGIPNVNGELNTDALETACRAHRPRLLYLVPTHNNPTGRTLTEAGRRAVLQMATTHDFLVLEDDTYGWLGFEQPAPSALKSSDSDDRVVYITSFSKILAPALRLGAIVAPASRLHALAATKQSSDLVCSTLMQRALAHYIQHGLLATHLVDVRSFYLERRDAMIDSLQRHLSRCTWTCPEGGLSLWVELPAQVIERDFTIDALQQGIGIVPGVAFFAEPRRQAAMRLSFGGNSPERIEQGTAVLGRVLESHLARHDGMSPLQSGAAGPLA